ncbi:hypothetical protein AB8O53_34620, partial [Streptomyces pilosus]
MPGAVPDARRAAPRPFLGHPRPSGGGRLDDSEQVPAPAVAEIGSQLPKLAGDRAAAYEAAEEALAHHRPTHPVWFLATIGVAPDAQRRGRGAAVLRPGPEAAEAAGFPGVQGADAGSHGRVW